MKFCLVFDPQDPPQIIEATRFEVNEAGCLLIYEAIKGYQETLFIAVNASRWTLINSLEEDTHATRS